MAKGKKPVSRNRSNKPKPTTDNDEWMVYLTVLASVLIVSGLLYYYYQQENYDPTTPGPRFLLLSDGNKYQLSGNTLTLLTPSSLQPASSKTIAVDSTVNGVRTITMSDGTKLRVDGEETISSTMTPPPPRPLNSTMTPPPPPKTTPTPPPQARPLNIR